MCLAQGVADAADRLDQPRLVALLGLPAEVADVDVERVGAEAEVVAPDALEDHRPGQHLPRIEQEELQQRELGARQLDRIAAAVDEPGRTGRARRRRTGARRLPAARAAEAARAAAPAARRARTASRRSRRRRRRGRRPGRRPRRARSASGSGSELPALRRRRQASSPSSRGIETSRTTASTPSPLSRSQRLLAVAGQLDVVALELEGAAERVPDGGFVVDDENLHTVIVRTELRRRLRTSESLVRGIVPRTRALPRSRDGLTPRNQLQREG